MFKKIFWAQGVVCPCPRGIIHVYDHNIAYENILGPGVVCPCPCYIHVDNHNIQTASSLKPLGQSKPNFFGASLGRGNESLYKWSRSHDQDGRHGYK